jgi:hypothetical protein
MIRQITRMEDVPWSTPRRYRNQAGYIRLRWALPDGVFAECYEHRLVCGFPDGHVHHINGRKDDNRPDNLRVVTSAEHGREHRDFDHAEAAKAYAAGLTTTEVGTAFGVTAGQVSRALRAMGVQMRPPAMPKVDAPIDCICVMHSVGMSANRIASEVGVSAQIARRVVRDAGLPSHPVGRKPGRRGER